MDIHVKPHVHKVDPKHPQSTDPTYEPARRKAEQVAKKNPPKFESEGERKDYEKRVKSNPNNFYGVPHFYPPLKEPFQGQVFNPARGCECGGCAVARNQFICPRCGQYVKSEGET